MKSKKISLFIFRRDLRLNDNTGLLNALKNSDLVIPCFCIDPRQVENNDYKSNNALQFMIESLEILQQAIKKQKSYLFIFYGMPEEILEHIYKHVKFTAVYTNIDYTPFSIHRDTNLAAFCLKHNIGFLQFHDYILNTPQTVLKKDGKPYTVFSAFFKKAQTNPVANPQKNILKNYYKQQLPKQFTNLKSLMHKLNPKLHIHGGTTNCLELIKLLGNQQNYVKTHDIPSISTTNLSAHLKFGTVSVRQVFYEIKKQFGASHPLIRQLYWRDFFTHVAFHFPQVFGHSFNKKYANIKWNTDAKQFNLWAQGKTGFPIVDAGMRQLNTTGFMHNRVRMIVASFLTKDLGIDWRKGEKYFAQKLIDYDPSVNNGNWQWVASTGCDAQPYFRIFNPWLQQKKFDPNAIYIKKWIPELQNLTAKQIHAAYKLKTIGYPKPIVDHATQAQKTKTFFKNMPKNLLP